MASLTRALTGLTIAALIASGASGTGRAQQKDPMDLIPDLGRMRAQSGQSLSPDELYALLDADGDGCVTESEWLRRKMAIFFVLDREGTDPLTGGRGDSMLTRAEVPRLGEPAFAAADRDGDGRISDFEFNQAPFVRYEAVARDSAGCLTLVQFGRYVDGLRSGA
jgi:hypothetical protein